MKRNINPTFTHIPTAPYKWIDQVVNALIALLGGGFDGTPEFFQVEKLLGTIRQFVGALCIIDLCHFEYLVLLSKTFQFRIKAFVS